MIFPVGRTISLTFSMFAGLPPGRAEEEEEEEEE